VKRLPEIAEATAALVEAGRYRPGPAAAAAGHPAPGGFGEPATDLPATVTHVSDSTGTAPQSSEQQAQEYARQLRSAPVEQIVTEILSGLLNAAQVKLGRRDARLLIDLTALVHEQARRYLPADLTKQVDQLLAQLRLAQVQSESAAADQPAEPNDLAEVPTPPAGAATPPPAPSAPQPGQPPPGQPPPASRLWVPGRDF
jgi:hypothetical protein